MKININEIIKMLAKGIPVFFILIGIGVLFADSEFYWVFPLIIFSFIILMVWYSNKIQKK